MANKGESFIYDNDMWTDLTEYEPRTRLLDDYAIDNFSIKAYLIVNISEKKIVKISIMNQEKQGVINMDLAGAYQEIDKRLSRIDFPLLFRGFHRFPFALYDDWVGKTRVRIEETLKKGALVLDGDYRLFAFNPYDALWDGRYAVLSYFIGYIEGTAHPATDEELFSMMKILNGDFVAQLDEEMHFCRLWRQ